MLLMQKKNKTKSVFFKTCKRPKLFSLFLDFVLSLPKPWSTENHGLPTDFTFITILHSYAIINMAAALLAFELGFVGPNSLISTACATSNYLLLCCFQPHSLRALSQRNDDPQMLSGHEKD